MSEQNKVLVRHMLETAWSGDLSVLEEHPGMHETIPFMTAMMDAADKQTNVIHEQIADGDWVATRFTTEVTLKHDFMGAPAGSQFQTEAIMMHKIEGGVIVKQYSQGGRTDQG